MAKEITCPNPKCHSTNFINLHAEQNIFVKVEGKPLRRSKLKGPKYECRDCGNKF